jgi:hypothetical protein
LDSIDISHPLFYSAPVGGISLARHGCMSACSGRPVGPH